MKEIEAKVHNTYGSPRKHVKYNSYKGAFGKTCGNLLLVKRVIPGTNKKTTDRDFEAKEPLMKWTIDVTEFKTKEGKVYLAPIMDLFNQEIISFVCSSSPDMDQQFRILGIALERYGNSPLTNLIFHSDQG